MTESRWIPIAILWIVTLIVSGVLWVRFTRIPARSPGFTARVPGLQQPVTTRRVVPLWLALVLLIVLIAAVWLTVRLAAGG